MFLAGKKDLVLEYYQLEEYNYSFGIKKVFLSKIYLGGYNMETLQKVLLVITIIGAVNWGLVGLLDIDLVALLFGSASLLSRIVYTLVGICGIINVGILLGHIDYEKD